LVVMKKSSEKLRQTSGFVVCRCPTLAALTIGAQAHFGPSEKFTGRNQN